MSDETNQFHLLEIQHAVCSNFEPIIQRKKNMGEEHLLLVLYLRQVNFTFRQLLREIGTGGETSTDFQKIKHTMSRFTKDMSVMVITDISSKLMEKKLLVF